MFSKNIPWIKCKKERKKENIFCLALFLTYCTFWPHALFDRICGWDPIKISIYLYLPSRPPQGRFYITNTVQLNYGSTITERREEQIPETLPALPAFEISQWNLHEIGLRESNRMKCSGQFFFFFFLSCTIPAVTFLVCLNVILFPPLPIPRLLQHATIFHNNNSIALIENTPFLHKHKHLKALNMAIHCNLLEMRRKLKSLAVKLFPEFLS